MLRKTSSTYSIIGQTSSVYDIKQELPCSKKRRMRMFWIHSEIISYIFESINQLINRVYLERLIRR